MQSRATPPSRPSRDGTPDLHSQIPDPPPIVHSNLTHAPSVPERPSTAGRQQSFSPLPRRTTPSPSLGKPAARSALVGPGREATPKPRPSLASPLTSPEKATKSANTSTFNTRFPFFSKRSKTAPISAQSTTSLLGKALWQAPDMRATAGSVRSEGAAGACSSGAQTSSLSHPDQLSMQQICGHVPAGPHKPRCHFGRRDCSQPQHQLRPQPHRQPSEYWYGSTQRRLAVGLGDLDHIFSSQKLNRISSLPRVTRPRVSNRRPSDSSDSEAVAMKSTLAYRRSVQRLRASPEQEPLRIPRPIITSRGASPALNSKDTGFRTDDSMPDSEWEGARDARQPRRRPES